MYPPKFPFPFLWFLVKSLILQWVATSIVLSRDFPPEPLHDTSKVSILSPLKSKPSRFGVESLYSTDYAQSASKYYAMKGSSSGDGTTSVTAAFEAVSSVS